MQDMKREDVRRERQASAPNTTPHRGTAFVSNAFFRLPDCNLDLRGDLGLESVSSVSLPLDGFMKERPRSRIAVPRTLDLALTWATLGAKSPAPGAILRVLVARNRMVDKTPELSLWTVAPGSNHQPELFGRAVLQAGPSK